MRCGIHTGLGNKRDIPEEMQTPSFGRSQAFQSLYASCKCSLRIHHEIQVLAQHYKRQGVKHNKQNDFRTLSHHCKAGQNEQKLPLTRYSGIP